MKRKSLIPILILSCAGATMCSRKNDTPAEGDPASKQTAAATQGEAQPAGMETGKPAGNAASALLGLTVGTHTFYLLKAADAKVLPKGKFLGKEAFLEVAGKVSGKAAGKAADKTLLVVLVPSQAKGSKLTLEAGGKKTPLAAPALIYRMPDSPAHTYAIVDAQAPGRLTVTSPDGVTGGIDLGATAGFLDALPHHWKAEEDGYLGYKSLPKSLYGKLPR